MAMLNPPHPGQFLRTEILDAISAAAKTLRVSQSTLLSVLEGKTELSSDIALRFEMAFGVKADTLMRMQTSYETAQGVRSTSPKG